MRDILIKGENRSQLLLSDFLFEGAHFSAYVEIKSDWYQARAKFHSSNGRMSEFLSGLHNVLYKTHKELNFINEDGNFDLDLSISNLGKVVLRGTLSKNMVDEAELNYEFESDLQGLRSFYDSLKALIEQES